MPGSCLYAVSSGPHLQHLLQGQALTQLLSEQLSRSVPGRSCALHVLHVLPLQHVCHTYCRFKCSDPLSTCVQESLDDLNVHLQEAGEQAIPMDRFRPNIQVSGAACGYLEVCALISRLVSPYLVSLLRGSSCHGRLQTPGPDSALDGTRLAC